MLDKNAVLKQYFGHSTFREGQEKIVDTILQRRDVLCVMPTGAGKSVCYQVPALMFDGVTLVISPLISLMKDQVNALTQNGIRAAYINSSLTYAQCLKAIANVKAGMYKIVYVAPERLETYEFIEACKSVNISFIAVDEAHCISQWGQDFRPSYLRIADFVFSLGYRPPIAAFTATATAEVKDDIEYALNLVSPLRVTTGFDRPNLRFEVNREKKKFEQLLKILTKHANDSGIVYCTTRNTVEDVTEKLKKKGFSATKYHAGLEAEERKNNQEDFVYDRKMIMVATNAFGMGIDKSNVAYVVHYNMPKDLESYYQEAGRAGRDGAQAECILLYSRGDVRTNRFLIENATPNVYLTIEQQALLREREYDRLRKMTYYATINTCLRSYILEYFGEKTSNYCGNCSNCLTEFEEVDITEDAQTVLSCIESAHERFGKKTICDILKGARNKKTIRLGLEKHPSFGTFKTFETHQIRDIIDLLEREGYLISVGNAYPILKMTEKAVDVLSNNESVKTKRAKAGGTFTKRAKYQKVAEGIDGDLFMRLKAVRRRLADEKRVPAYVIFTDAVLIEMCKKMPTNKYALLGISGVGMVKCECYGDIFVEEIKIYRERHNNIDED